MSDTKSFKPRKTVNKVILVGTCGKAPELGHYGSGSAHCKFPLATNEVWKDKPTGELKEATDWHTIKAVGKQAETIAKWLKKGDEFYVEGELRNRPYKVGDETRYDSHVRVIDFKFLTSNPASKPASNERASSVPGQQPHQVPPVGHEDGIPDDMPPMEDDDFPPHAGSFDR